MELQREFFETYTHSDVQSAARPYEFLKFGTSSLRLLAKCLRALTRRADPFLEKTRKRYVNTRTLRTSHNLAELSERLQQLRVLNIGDVLGADYKANYNNGTQRETFHVIPFYIFFQVCTKTERTVALSPAGVR